MSASLTSLIPEFRPWAAALVNAAASAGLQPRVTSTRRSHAFQARLYRRFLAGQSQYPVAPPGTSSHEFGYALDLIISPYDLSLFKELGDLWSSWGGVWGGAFNDPIHFEYPGFSAVPRHQPSAVVGTVASAIDLILGLTPGIGEVELAAELLKLGFPSSAILQFLSSPVLYAAKRLLA